MLLSVSSCDKDGAEDIAVSISRDSATASAGSDLVSVTCSGSWVLTLYSASGTVDWASISPSSGTGSNSKVVLEYEANEMHVSRSLMIILTASGKDVSCEFTQAANTDQDEPDDSGSASYETVDATTCGWLELPATYEGDGLSYYYHTADFSGTTFRNYSFYWDKKNHLSHWVAYPLNAWSISSGSRSNAWGQVDPLVPEEEQANMANSYRNDSDGNSYDRGHQIASADRLDLEPNRQTFYPTNMTPQLSNFNQNIWANLESKVRNWAKQSDTLYVVTGCVIDGYTTTTTDRDDMVCPIPVAYYKVLLRYSKSSTLGYSGYMGCAVYMDHHAYADKTIYASYAMSIDDLEEKLGIDFFVNLPALIGETAAANVEKEDPIKDNWWGFATQN